jgi:hypothetical protein
MEAFRWAPLGAFDRFIRMGAFDRFLIPRYLQLRIHAGFVTVELLDQIIVIMLHPGSHARMVRTRRRDCVVRRPLARIRTDDPDYGSIPWATSFGVRRVRPKMKVWPSQ